MSQILLLVNIAIFSILSLQQSILKVLCCLESFAHRNGLQMLNVAFQDGWIMLSLEYCSSKAFDLDHLPQKIKIIAKVMRFLIVESLMTYYWRNDYKRYSSFILPHSEVKKKR